MKSHELYNKASELLPGGVNSPVRAFDPYPFFVDSGKGSRIWDIEGNEYIDYCLGYGPLILGHRDPKVMRTVREQMKRGTHFGIPNNPEVKLAKEIVQHVPCADMVRFVNSGTEATMNAIRLARAYTGREKVLMFDGGYHGSQDNLLFDRNGAKTPGIPKGLESSALVASFNELEKTKEISERNELAAIIVEPVMGNIGCISPNDGFLEGLRELCDGNETLLIFDEVITGFRLSMGGAQKYYGVEPDLVTLGKIIGGGFPVGAFAGRKDIMENVKPEGIVHNAGTFSGHPIAMVAGTATIKRLKKGNVLDEASKFAERLAAVLRREFGFPVNQEGPMLQIFFKTGCVKNANDARKSDRKKFRTFHRSLLKEGIFIPPSRLECWFISSTHSKDDFMLSQEAIEKASERAEKGG